jgi:hypothetical protein
VSGGGVFRRVDAVCVPVPDLDAGLREPNWLVDNVEDAVAHLVEHGSVLIAAPFDIPVGRAGVVRDPFGNTLVLVDLSGGTYATDPATDPPDNRA